MSELHESLVLRIVSASQWLGFSRKFDYFFQVHYSRELKVHLNQNWHG